LDSGKKHKSQITNNKQISMTEIKIFKPDEAMSFEIWILEFI